MRPQPTAVHARGAAHTHEPERRLEHHPLDQREAVRGRSPRSVRRAGCPAWLTRMSACRSRPRPRPSIDSARERSATSARPPTSSATARAPSSSRSSTRMCAPAPERRAATARPMPLAPPVTTAVRPSRLEAAGAVCVPESGVLVSASARASDAESYDNGQWFAPIPAARRGQTRSGGPSTVGRMPSTAPRSLADQLRGWPDGSLVRLLSARPDLASPAPQDSSQLASRASTRASVVRALDQLTVLELTVLDAVVAVGGSAPAELILHPRERRSRSSPDAAVDRLDGLLRCCGAPTRSSARSVSSRTRWVRRSAGWGPSAETLLAGYGPNRAWPSPGIWARPDRRATERRRLDSGASRGRSCRWGTRRRGGRPCPGHPPTVPARDGSRGHRGVRRAPGPP